MQYYKIYNDNGEMIAIGTDCGGVEITREEYLLLETEITAKAIMVDAVLEGELDPSEIPNEWREEILRRVEQRRQEEPTVVPEEISADEALGIILGGELP